MVFFNKTTFILCLIFTAQNIFSAEPVELVEIRNLFYEAATEKDRVDNFYDYLEAKSDLSEIVLGYKAMAFFLKAKYAFNPYTKLKHFIEGKNLLDATIMKAPGLVELRYLRFTIQTNVPKFLGYRHKIFEDKDCIVNAIRNKEINDDDLLDRMLEYLYSNKYLNSSEHDMVSQIIK